MAYTLYNMMIHPQNVTARLKTVIKIEYRPKMLPKMTIMAKIGKIHRHYDRSKRDITWIYLNERDLHYVYVHYLQRSWCLCLISTYVIRDVHSRLVAQNTTDSQGLRYL